MNRARFEGLVVAVFCLILSLGFVGCGGGGGDGAEAETPPQARVGAFVDSPVQGLEYRTRTCSGVTDAAGTFTFRPGETVVFSVGDVVLGEVLAKPVMTPLSLVPEAVDENHREVVNIARFLQSLDVDGDVRELTNLSAEERGALKGVTPINFDQEPEEFSNDPQVIALFDKLNSLGVFSHGQGNLCDAATAINHLRSSLSALPTIALSSPNGKELLVSGTPVEVTWQSSSTVERVSILLSQDGGETWSSAPIAESVPNSGSYTWSPPLVATRHTRNRVRVVDAGNAANLDESDADFTILFPMSELGRIISASDGTDRDSDHLPDDVEQFLGTDPDHRDSDHDGMWDYDEVMRGQSSNGTDGLPDGDGDGVIAALDDDDDNDGVHDGEGIDSDGDGIANYLEYHGYTYDWFSDTYSLWDSESPDRPYFKTDPRQASTDQDPYSDAMEASGELLDVLTGHPGDLPMVPAYPNIVVRLEEYDVTLNGEVTYGEGGSLAEETSWSRETGKEAATAWTHGWEVGVEVSIGKESGVKLSGKYSGSRSGTNTASSSSSRGASITSESNWERATSSNPSQAARVKLKFKMYNYGTAAASNVLPTLTMKIGGLSVLTFRPDEPINILPPGGVYPSQERTYWVVEKSADSEYIYLTLEELRALELGAPVSIAVTQMQADVMLLNSQGVWESAGSWAEYMARCEAVSSNVLLDVGSGHFIHQLVYSDDSETSPRVTFGDVLNWVGNGDANADAPYIQYYDWDRMQHVQAPLADFHFMFDTETLRSNGWVEDSGQLTHPDAETFDVKDMVLGPHTVIVGKASPEAVNKTGPTVHYAFYDEKMDHIVALASDYLGVAGMTLATPTGVFEMGEEIAGSGIFRLDAVNALTGTNRGCCSAPCSAEATNVRGETVLAEVTCLEYPEELPVQPQITSVLVRSVDADSVSLVVQVEEDARWPVAAVWVYDPLHPTSPALTLARDLNYWGDVRNRYYGTLDGYSYEGLTKLVVVAECDRSACPITNPDCSDTHTITSGDIDMDSIASGSGRMIIRTEHYGLAFRGLYSFTDFYEEQGPNGYNFDHYGEGWTGLYDTASMDNAITAHPEAEVFFANKKTCLLVNVPAFMINANWLDAGSHNGAEWTAARRIEEYETYDAAWIANKLATSGWPLEPYSTNFENYDIPKLYDVPGECDAPGENQFEIVFFEIPGTPYVVKFMFHEYSFNHIYNWSDAVRYTYDVYNIGSSGPP